MYIMRGIPGSGKSFKAKQLAPESNIFSTDDYWISDNVYKFQLAKLKEAHEWNRQRAQFACVREVTPVVIDNTNISKKERLPYIEIAELNGYTWEVVLPDSEWFMNILPRLENKQYTEEDIDAFFTRNSHNVPRETIRAMMHKWSDG